ncbi:DUF4485 domain-containing protein [Flavobacterium sp. SLB02]|nr:DUF4485 domain-containing protein [Flavobacterium sp. SLB02]
MNLWLKKFLTIYHTNLNHKKRTFKYLSRLLHYLNKINKNGRAIFNSVPKLRNNYRCK